MNNEQIVDTFAKSAKLAAAGTKDRKWYDTYCLGLRHMAENLANLSVYFELRDDLKTIEEIIWTTARIEEEYKVNLKPSDESL